MQKTNYDITIVGLNFNRLLSEFNGQNIKLYNFNKPEYKIMNFSLTFFDYLKFKKLKILKSYDVKINKLKGSVKLLNNMFKHLGLVICAIICFALFLLFSNYTFKINIYGLEDIKESEIITLLNQINVKTKQINKKSNDDIEQFLKQNNSKISLVSVVRKGTNLVINIKEKIEVNLDTNPIYAPYNMQITKLNVVQGTTKFKVGDIIKKGEIIVNSKTILSNGESAELEPIAEVEGNTWITGNIEFKTKEIKKVKTGKKLVVTHYELNGNKLFYKTPNVKFELFDKVVYNKIIFNNWFLPLSFCKTTYYELKEIIETKSFEENKVSLINESKNLAYKSLPKGKEVIEENVKISNIDTTYFITTYLKINIVI